MCEKFHLAEDASTACISFCGHTSDVASSAASGTDGVPTKRDVGQRYNTIIKLESRKTSLMMSYICHTYLYEQQVRLTLAALLMAPPV